jgi:solute carrier family 44 (choline transporter-like protein), member 2/4/5
MVCCSKSSNRSGVVGITPYSERSCTDILFLLLFFGSLAATAYLAEYSIEQGGDYNRVLRGVDLQGRICGKDIGVENAPLAAWPYPLEYESKICVSSCAETQTNANIATKHASTEFLFYCVPIVNASAGISLSGDFNSYSQQFTRAIGDLYTARLVMAGTPIAALLFSFLYVSCAKRFAGTLVWGVLFSLMLAGAFIGYSLLQMAGEYDADIDQDRIKAIKISAYISIGFSVTLAVVVFTLRNRIRVAVEVIKEASRAISKMTSLVLFPIIPFVLTIAYIFFWGVVALYLYSVADKTTKSTPSTVTAGVGNTNPTTQVVYERRSDYNNAIAYHFFNLLWVMQFFLYFAFCVVAGAVADWYFSARPSNAAGKAVQRQQDIEAAGAAGGGAAAGNGNSVAPSKTNGNRKRAKIVPVQNAWGDEPVVMNAADDSDLEEQEFDGKVHVLSKTPVWDSCKRVLRFHLGTVAFGAFIIALINFVRVVVKYIEEKSKNRDNRFQKMCFCMIQCCLKCMHCCADKISRNAFIWCSIWGDNFATSAVGSFQLIWNNLARVAAINLVGAYLLLLGKLMVALLTAGAVGVVLLYVDGYKDDINSPVLPCVVAFFVGYFVASIFMVVYDTAIDTIFLCFLVDAEFNADGNMMASDGLKKLVSNYQDHSKRKSKRMKQARGEIELTEVQAIANGGASDNVKSL